MRPHEGTTANRTVERQGNGAVVGRVYDMTHMDGFPSLRVGRRLKIKRRLLLEWLDGVEVTGHSKG